jgi:hypothetical protein
MRPPELTRYGDSDGDDAGDKSGAHCTCKSAARNNTNTDSRRRDSSERTGARNSRKDNN